MAPALASSSPDSALPPRTAPRTHRQQQGPAAAGCGSATRARGRPSAVAAPCMLGSFFLAYSGPSLAARKAAPECAIPPSLASGEPSTASACRPWAHCLPLPGQVSRASPTHVTPSTPTHTGGAGAWQSGGSRGPAAVQQHRGAHLLRPWQAWCQLRAFLPCLQGSPCGPGDHGSPLCLPLQVLPEAGGKPRRPDGKSRCRGKDGRGRGAPGASGGARP